MKNLIINNILLIQVPLVKRHSDMARMYKFTWYPFVSLGLPAVQSPAFLPLSPCSRRRASESSETNVRSAGVSRWPCS